MTDARTVKSRAEEAALWWVDLSKGLAGVATAVATRDPALRWTSREGLWDACVRWGGLMGHPLAAALMADHVALLAAFVDAADRRDQAAMSAIVAAALMNAEDQAKLYGSDSPRFPQDAFREAMALHIARTSAYAAALIAKDMPRFQEAFKRASEARDALSFFWIRVLLPSESAHSKPPETPGMPRPPRAV